MARHGVHNTLRGVAIYGVYGQPREAAVFIGMCVNLLLPEEENEKWLEARIELVTLRLQVEHSPSEPLARTIRFDRDKKKPQKSQKKGLYVAR